MIPKIIFRYSWIYDEKWKEEFKKNKNGKYPSSKKILNYIKKIEKMWNKDENKILTELSKISKLKWEEEKIYCYVVGRARPFSDPLTITVYETYTNWFIDVLIHELVHQLLSIQNLQKTKKAFDYINKKYKNETLNTRIHIPLHAIHKHIYLKFFNKKRLDREIRLMSKLEDYKRSWEIVQKEGYENIIKEFVKRIR